MRVLKLGALAETPTRLLSATIYALRLLGGDPMSLAALIVVLGVFSTAVSTTVLLYTGVVSESVYAGIDLGNRLKLPSLEHPLGTDHLGRDILVRIVFGTRIALYVIAASVTIAIVLGTLVGLVAGYMGGYVDLVVSRIIDAIMSFPAVLLALAIVAVLGPGIENVVLAIGIAEAPVFARLARGLVAVEKEHLYVEAARATGASHARIIWKHILPNIAGPLLVQATFTSSSAILWEAALSFLGLGAQPPTPSWGLMLAEARGYMRVAPHTIVFPGLAIFLLVLSINILGEKMRDLMDPRYRSLAGRS
ncbi:MAG: ABC transporter permease [Acidilobaceae archaeon]